MRSLKFVAGRRGAGGAGDLCVATRVRGGDVVAVTMVAHNWFCTKTGYFVATRWWLVGEGRGVHKLGRHNLAC